MAITYIDTVNIQEISKELVSLGNDLNNEFDRLFLRLSEVPNVTQEWVGDQAKYYFSKAYKDKKQYTEFASKIKEIGHTLNSDIIDIQMIINDNNVNESEKEV